MTPDFRVYHGGVPAFYCEVKTVEKDLWLRRQLDVVSPGTIGGGRRNDPVYNRFAKGIYTASKQFDAVNPDFLAPNAKTFVSYDAHCTPYELLEALTGNVDLDCGRLVPMFAKYAEGRIRERRSRIHMYAWFTPQRLSYALFTDANNEYYACLRGYFGVDRSAEIPVVRRTL